MLWEDFAWLALLYVLANLARGIMIAALSPLVNLVGGSDVTRTTWKECVAGSLRLLRTLKVTHTYIYIYLKVTYTIYIKCNRYMNKSIILEWIFLSRT